MALLRRAASVAGVALVESDARQESEADFVERLERRPVDRIRLLSPLGDDTRRVLHRRNVAIDDAAPVSAGFVELSRWVREQAVSRTLHRHGRLLPTSTIER